MKKKVKNMILVVDELSSNNSTITPKVFFFFAETNKKIDNSEYCISLLIESIFQLNYGHENLSNGREEKKERKLRRIFI